MTLLINSPTRKPEALVLSCADIRFYVAFRDFRFLCSFVALNIFTSACIIQIREGLKKTKKNMDISIFGSDPPTHPPNMDKNKKKTLFFGLFSSFGTKKILNFFHQTTHHCLPQDPSTAATHHRWFYYLSCL